MVTTNEIEYAHSSKRMPWLIVTLLITSLWCLECQAMPPMNPRALEADYGGCAGTVPENTLAANPSNYISMLATLSPGDVLQLEAGTYNSGLPLNGFNGEENRCIIIEGPADGPPAVLVGRNCCNTVSIQNSSYLVIRNLEIAGGDTIGDGVKTEGTSQWAHHITLENLYIHWTSTSQGIVGISTKCPAWNFVIRDNVIEAAGTGLYLGNSGGDREFVHSLIENNLVFDTIGYNMQIKHQNSRDLTLGMPADGITIIRRNVFSKVNNASTGGSARPNLLVGHWPLSGPGSDDIYLIYGNFFYQNPTESLFQGEGNVALYDNLFVTSDGRAIAIQPHNDVPRMIRIFHNTVLASTTGINVTGGNPSFTQQVLANASFAATPISASNQADNITDSFANAVNYLNNPFGVVTGTSNRLDLYPLVGTLNIGVLDSTELQVFLHWNRDFNNNPRDFSFRGGYAGQGQNPGWQLALERPPTINDELFRDGFESGDLSAWNAAVP